MYCSSFAVTQFYLVVNFPITAELVQSTTLAFMLDLLLLTHKRCWNFQFLTKKIALFQDQSHLLVHCSDIMYCKAKLISDKRLL